MLPLEKYYNRHKENLRLQRRHGLVEFRVALKYILDYLPKNEDKKSIKILDLGAGTGRYTIELHNMGYDILAVEPVQHNIDVMLQNAPYVQAKKGNALDLSFLQDETFDAVIAFGPMYHLISEKDKLQALSEIKRVTKPDAVIFIAYIQNDYSILTYCFAENRMPELVKNGFVDENFHIHAAEDEMYDFASLEYIEELNQKAGFQRLTILSPDGPSDYMRTQLNYMSDETFELFIKYQMCRAEQKDLLAAGSHLVDIVKKL